MFFQRSLHIFTQPIPADWSATLTTSKRGSAGQGEWDRLPIANLSKLEELLTTHRVGSKDGRCILQGTVFGKSRAKNAMDNLSIIGIDVDNGTPIKELLAKVQDAGLYCIWYTTHSHMKTTSDVSRDDWNKWCEKNNTTDVYTFLRNEKRYTESVARSAYISNDAKGAERGLVVEFTHIEMEKARLFFILANPWDHRSFPNSKIAVESWTKAYKNFAAWIGIEIDKSCVDPSRLFYLPRHSQSSPYDSGVIEGDAIDIFALPNSAEDSFNVAARELGAHTRPENDITAEVVSTLRFWYKQYGKRFKIVDALEDFAPEVFRHTSSDTSVKFHIECPFDHEHTTVSHSATFIANPSDGEFGTESFVIYCQHSCKERYQKLDYLAEMISKGWLPVSCLTDQNYLYAQEEEKETEEFRNFKEVIDPHGDVLEDINCVKDGEDAEKYIRYLAYSGTTIIVAEQKIRELCLRVNVSKSVLSTTFKRFERDYLNQKRDEKKRREELEERDKRVRQETEDALKSLNKSMDRLSAKIELINKKEDERVPIDVDTDFLLAVQKSVEALAFKNQEYPKLFRFDGLVRVVKDERGLLKIDRMGRSEIRYELARVARFMRIKNEQPVEIAPPTDIVEDICSDNDLPFPLLHGIANTPIFGPDSTLKIENGYDPGSKLFLDSSSVKMKQINKEPTVEEIELAKDLLLNNVLVDFPFDGPQNGACEKAHALAMILQPFVRQMIDGATPIYLITKPSPGTGGSKLVNIYSLLAHGEKVDFSTETRSEEEFRKKITAIMREGQHTFCLDNVNAKIDSSALASVVTAESWRDRLLGSSSTVTCPVRCTFIVIGNNPKMSNEISRRCVRIRLDAKIEKPENRTGFKIKNLEEYVTTNRSELVWACLTLIQNWIAKGRIPGEISLGSFESWSRTLGGILRDCGVPGFLGNRNEMASDVDEEGSAIKTLLSMWWKSFQNKEVGLSENNNIFDLVDGQDLPLPIFGATPRAQRVSFATYLNKLQGRIFEISILKKECQRYPENHKDDGELVRFQVRIDKGKSSLSQTWALNTLE